LYRGGLVNSHDNKGVLAYSFALLAQATSGNVLATAPKDTGMFRGRRTLDFDGRNTLSQNLMIGLIFTCVSLVRSYLLRRAFEARRVRQAKSSSSMAACTTNPVK
jgi:hypothetical protein